MGCSRYLVRLIISLLHPSDCAASWNHGQACCAGSRIFVQDSIYDEFLKRFTEHTKNIKVGDPFDPENFQGPQVSEVQYEVRSRSRARSRPTPQR